MATLSALWWKANKAKTLIREPLTKALEDFDEKSASAGRLMNREGWVAMGESADKVIEAIAATKKSCIGPIHGATIKMLGDLDRAAWDKKTFVATAIADHDKFVPGFKKMKTATASAVKALVDVNNPDLAKVGTASKMVGTMLTQVNSFAGVKGGSLGGLIKFGADLKLTLDSIIKELGEEKNGAKRNVQKFSMLMEEYKKRLENFSKDIDIRLDAMHLHAG